MVDDAEAPRIKLGPEAFPLMPPDDFVLERTAFQELGEQRVGKVRDIYIQDDQIILLATDRYSAFDRNLALVPYKGELVTQVSRFWFERTRHIIGNHTLEYPDPNVTVVRKCRVVPVEMVVRGFISGVTDTSLWKQYEEGRRDFGDFTLPDGLLKNQRLDRPLITPSTKFEKHDRPLTLTGVVEEGLVDPKTRDRLVDVSLELFGFGQQLASEQGLVLVDTKYEFGLTEDGEIILIDELHTPDSSRYWQMDSYLERFEQGLEPENFDKEFLRLWFIANSHPYEDEVMPAVPTELISELVARYIRAYEQLTGQRFQANLEIPILERLGHNLQPYRLKKH